MEETPKKLISKKGMAIDLVVTVLWFAFFSVALRPYVPAQTETFRAVIAVITAASITGVFYLAINMFRVVRVDQKNRAND